MDKQAKIYLMYAVSIGAVTAALAFMLFSLAYFKSRDFYTARAFTVSGEGKVIAIPDIARFTFSVITQGGKDLGDLQQENTEKINRAVEFVKTSGTESKDIKTQSYNVEPRYQYFSCPEGGGACPPPEIVGYTISQTVSVKIRDFGKIGDLLSGVIKSGANSVSQLSFTVDDPSALQNQAREQAIQKAREKAVSTAKAGGFRLGKLISVEENGFAPQPVPLYRYEAFGKGGDSISAPAIESGSEEITINVVLKYGIK